MKLVGRWTWIVVATGVAIAGAVVAARPMIKRQALLGAMGPGRAPSAGAMDSFVATYGDAAVGLEVLWDSGGVNQREYVLEYLHRGFVPGSETWKKFRGRVAASVAFPDEMLREDALLLLEKERDSATAELALPLLRDADPQARVTGLHALAAVEKAAYLPAAAELLEDRDPAVRVQAAATVFKLAGLKTASGETVEESARAWWKEHKSVSGQSAEAAPRVGMAFPMAPELRLVDVNGGVVDLRGLRGKVVLLNFWATWCGPCLEELPTLQAVASRHADDVVVIGVCIDAAPDDDGDAPAVTQAEVEEKIAGLIKKNGVTYRMALDTDGRAMNAFGGESVPTSILIDGSGRVRRRLVGVRSTEAWEGMIADLQ